MGWALDLDHRFGALGGDLRQFGQGVLRSRSDGAPAGLGASVADVSRSGASLSGDNKAIGLRAVNGIPRRRKAGGRQVNSRSVAVISSLSRAPLIARLARRRAT
jgi:hypothetical protein